MRWLDGITDLMDMEGFIKKVPLEWNLKDEGVSYTDI